MSNDIYTEDLGQFGSIELKEASKLILAIDNGLPDDFYHEGIKIGFNRNSGYVFLTNSDLQVAMYDKESDELYSYYSTPYDGYEGSLEELITEYDDMCKEDQEYVDNLRKEVSNV
jgi:hypothetical protein